jgi:protein-S-isoprenylcysteine O-methyltransferase Ste14
MWKAVGVFGALWLYWLAPLLLIWTRAEPPGWLLCLSVAAMVLGTFTVFGADAQKYFVLKARRGLITDGFFARTRNPNYLGEMLIYGSFAALSMHWAPWLVCAAYWVGVFVPNMLRKDRSMSRYPEWAWYTARTGLLFPQPWQPAAAPPVLESDVAAAEARV